MELAAKGRARPPNNLDLLLKEEEKVALIHLPRSKFILKCRGIDEETWHIELFNPYNMDTVVIYERMSIQDFETLVFNIWSIKTEEEQIVEQNKRDIAFYQVLLDRIGHYEGPTRPTE